jgi:hypothetical protein
MLIIFSILIITAMTKKVLSNEYLIAKQIKSESSDFTFNYKIDQMLNKSFFVWFSRL